MLPPVITDSLGIFSAYLICITKAATAAEAAAAAVAAVAAAGACRLISAFFV